MPVAAPRSEPCPLCGQGTRYRFRKQEADHRQCGSCGFRFARGERNPNLDVPLTSFEPAYVRYLAADDADAVNFEECWQWMSAFGAGEGSRILDVGAGSGKFVRFLRARGIAAEGVEPSAALFDRFLAGDESFRHGDAAARRPAADGTFDVVTTFDVIEHVERPASFLHDLAALLKPGGLLFISTPDVSSLAATIMRRWWHFYNRYHLSYFSTAVLARAARPHGLELVESRRRGRLRSLAYVAQYLSDFVGILPAGAARRFEGKFVRINLHDTMFLVFRKRESQPT